MRRLVAPLLLALALAASGCSGGESTTVTDDGVVETPTEQPNGGNGLDARSGDPLAPTPVEPAPSAS